MVFLGVKERGPKFFQEAQGGLKQLHRSPVCRSLLSFSQFQCVSFLFVSNLLVAGEVQQRKRSIRSFNEVSIVAINKRVCRRKFWRVSREVQRFISNIAS